MALSTARVSLQLGEVLEKKSLHNFRKPAQLSPACDICGSSMTFGFLSRERCAVPQLELFAFAVATPGLRIVQYFGEHIRHLLRYIVSCVFK